jgi:hypothetical protein
MAATLIVLAKLFATALMPAACSNNFFAAKNTFSSNFAFLAATFVVAKNDISCSDYEFDACHDTCRHNIGICLQLFAQRICLVEAEVLLKHF